MCAFLSPLPLWEEGWGEGLSGVGIVDVVCFIADSASPRWPGCAPGGAPPFLVRTRKGGKRKRPQVCDPFALLRGKPAARPLWGAPRNSLRAARFVQTTAASQSTKRVHPAVHAPPRKRRAAGAATGGLTRAIAALGPERESEAERSDGLCCRWVPSGRAEKRRGWGGHGQRSMPMLRALTRCGCPSEALQARSEFRSAATRPSIAGCPEAKRRGHGQWETFLLPTFL